MTRSRRTSRTRGRRQNRRRITTSQYRPTYTPSKTPPTLSLHPQRRHRRRSTPALVSERPPCPPRASRPPPTSSRPQPASTRSSPTISLAHENYLKLETLHSMLSVLVCAPFWRLLSAWRSVSTGHRRTCEVLTVCYAGMLYLVEPHGGGHKIVDSSRSRCKETGEIEQIAEADWQVSTWDRVRARYRLCHHPARVDKRPEVRPLLPDISWIMWMLTRDIYTSSTATASRTWVICSACRSSVSSRRCITPLILYSPVPYRYAINRLPDLIPLLLQLCLTDICLLPAPTENSPSKHSLLYPFQTYCLL